VPLRIVFAGTPAFAVPALDALAAAGHEIRAVYTQPDRPAGRGRKLAVSEVKARALARGLPVEQPQSMKVGESASRLHSFAPDVMIVVAYGVILPESVLVIPRLGCFNIHASLLPRWRGAAPIQHAILAGDGSTGITIMRMTAGLDTGPIVAQREQLIRDDMTAGELHDVLAGLGASLMVESLQSIAAGRVIMREQNSREASYAPKILRADARIRWSEPAELIARRVRAYEPWPGAETLWRDEQLKIWRTEVRVGQAGALPGEVLRANAGGIEIACGAGSLALLTLQLPGKKRISAADFVHAHALVGDRLT
jgi:methionyl-tRNA formyltransferase